MKKYLTFLLLTFPLFFFSCSDENGNDEDADALAGTEWSGTYDDEYSSNNTWTISFTKTNFTTKEEYLDDDINGDGLINNDDIITFTMSGTYTYNHPKVVLTFIDEEDNDTYDVEGIVSGNKITFTEDGLTVVVTKK